MSLTLIRFLLLAFWFLPCLLILASSSNVVKCADCGVKFFYFTLWWHITRILSFLSGLVAYSCSSPPLSISLSLCVCDISTNSYIPPASLTDIYVETWNFLLSPLASLRYFPSKMLNWKAFRFKESLCGYFQQTLRFRYKN